MSLSDRLFSYVSWSIMINEHLNGSKSEKPTFRPWLSQHTLIIVNAPLNPKRTHIWTHDFGSVCGQFHGGGGGVKTHTVWEFLVGFSNSVTKCLEWWSLNNQIHI